ncbi:hypothetical protein D3C86_2050700 [compost metagenome]
MEGIALDQAATATLGDGGTDVALATTSYTHYHQCGQGKIHRYLQRRDSAVFVRSRHRTGTRTPCFIDLVVFVIGGDAIVNCSQPETALP